MLAGIIDQLIIVFIAVIVGILLGFTLSAMGADIKSSEGLANICGILINWLYFAIMESSSTQATFGKQALGLIVTDTWGNPISFAKATGRHFGKIISGLIFGIGFFMIAFTEKKQGLHDILAGCLVLNKNL